MKAQAEEDSIIAVFFESSEQDGTYSLLAMRADGRGALLNKDTTITWGMNYGRKARILDSVLVYAEKLLPQMEVYEDKSLRPQELEVLIVVLTGDMKKRFRKVKLDPENISQDEIALLAQIPAIYEAE